MRFRLSLPGVTATVLSVLCLIVVVGGGAYPLTVRPNWRWSWESPLRAAAGYAIAVAAGAGAGRTGWLSLRRGKWAHVAVAAFFFAMAIVGVLLLWRSGAWLSDMRAELLDQ